MQIHVSVLEFRPLGRRFSIHFHWGRVQQKANVREKTVDWFLNSNTHLLKRTKVKLLELKFIQNPAMGIDRGVTYIR